MPKTVITYNDKPTQRRIAKAIYEFNKQPKDPPFSDLTDYDTVIADECQKHLWRLTLESEASDVAENAARIKRESFVLDMTVTKEETSPR